jgi:hypothetical protein
MYFSWAPLSCIKNGLKTFFSELLGEKHQYKQSKKTV